MVAADYNATCQAGVLAAFKSLLGWALEGNYSGIQAALGLCAAPQNRTEAVNTVALLQSVFSDLAQHDYPYVRPACPLAGPPLASEPAPLCAALPPVLRARVCAPFPTIAHPALSTQPPFAAGMHPQK